MVEVSEDSDAQLPLRRPRRCLSREVSGRGREVEIERKRLRRRKREMREREGYGRVTLGAVGIPEFC